MASSWQRKEAEFTSHKQLRTQTTPMTALQANTPAQAEILDRAAVGIGLHDNADMTEYVCYNQSGDVYTLNGSSLKVVDKFTYLGSNVLSTETDTTRD